jgi:hypothetical protein
VARLETICRGQLNIEPPLKRGGIATNPLYSMKTQSAIPSYDTNDNDNTITDGALLRSLNWSGMF